MGDLEPAAATRFIRGLYGPSLGLRYTKHARDRMTERGLIVSDILHVIRHGFVYKKGELSTRENVFKYEMECITPNSNGRVLRIVVIPSPSNWIKVVTVMWADQG